MRTARQSCNAYTLAEVLAALVLMGIVVVVALQGMKVSSRAGLLGQRKVAATRIAERVLDELIVTDQLSQSAASGTVTEGDTSYPWTMQTETWTQDSMTLVTVHVTFTLQGESHDVSLSTLYDPSSSDTSTSSSSSSSSS